MQCVILAGGLATRLRPITDNIPKAMVLVKNRPFLEEYAETVWDICERFGDRDCFVSKNCNMPDGFCSWAWADIQSYVMTLARGGNFIGVREGTYVSCCTDGFRPVFFLIERI